MIYSNLQFLYPHGHFVVNNVRPRSGFVGGTVPSLQLIEKTNAKADVWRCFAYESSKDGKIKDCSNPIYKNCYATILIKHSSKTMGLLIGNLQL